MNLFFITALVESKYFVFIYPLLSINLSNLPIKSKQFLFTFNAF